MSNLASNATSPVEPGCFSRPEKLWFAVLTLGLTAINCFVIVRFRFLDSDSIMYGLPLAFAKHPFDLGLPFIGQFEGYERAWGHHWMGAMWIRAGLFTILPFHRWIDIGFLLLCQWGSACLAAHLLVRATGRHLLAWAGALVILSDRLILTGVQLHRFEAVATLAITTLLVFAYRVDRQSGWGWLAGGLAAAFFAPTLHPYAIPLGGLAVAAVWVKAVLWRQAPARIGWAVVAAYGLGLLAFVGWFALSPDAKEQFLTNLRVQTGFVSTFLDPLSRLDQYHFGAGYLLWGAAALASILIPLGQPQVLRFSGENAILRWLPAALFLGIAGVHTLTRCPNYSYLTLGNPSAVVLAGLLADRAARALPARLRIAAPAFVAALALLFAVIVPYRLIEFAKAGFPNAPNVVASALSGIPAGRTVFIPPPFWDGAAHDNQHRFFLWTFAVASAGERRKRYEQQTYAEARPGDYLVVDRLNSRGGDTHGVLPTFEYRPPDPRVWEFKREIKHLYPGTSLHGIDVAIYEFKGGRWPPALPPQ